MHYVVVMEVAHAPVILLLMITQKTEKARQLTMTTLTTTNKGSHSLRKVQFFLKFFKRPFAPPPLSFEHLSYFAGGVF